MKNCHKLSRNCSIHGKNREISGQYNFWTPIKNSIPDVWNWNCWNFFVQKLKWEVMAPCHPPPPLRVAMPLLEQIMKYKVAQFWDKLHLNLPYAPKKGSFLRIYIRIFLVLPKCFIIKMSLEWIVRCWQYWWSP